MGKPGDQDVDALSWLCGWYERQADGEWEHEFGITVETLDNPGWSVTIDLASTGLADRMLAREVQESGDEWMHVWTEVVSSAPGGESRPVFRGACSPRGLPEVFSRFRRWVESEA